jgi:hypothetical protein
MDGKNGMGWDELGVGLRRVGWLHMGCGGLRGFALVDGCMALIDTHNLFDVLGISIKLFKIMDAVWHLHPSAVRWASIMLVRTRRGRKLKLF